MNSTGHLHQHLNYHSTLVASSHLDVHLKVAYYTRLAVHTCCPLPAPQVVSSPLHRLRVHLHLEVAKCDAGDDSLIKVSFHKWCACRW